MARSKPVVSSPGFVAEVEPKPSPYVETATKTVQRGDRLLRVTIGKRFELVRTATREDMREVWEEIGVEDVTPSPAVVRHAEAPEPSAVDVEGGPV
jgi:hypothetical protein